jgi:hypothetical protein
MHLIYSTQFLSRIQKWTHNYMMKTIRFPVQFELPYICALKMHGKLRFCCPSNFLNSHKLILWAWNEKVLRTRVNFSSYPYTKSSFTNQVPCIKLGTTLNICCLKPYDYQTTVYLYRSFQWKHNNMITNEAL